MGSGGSSPNEIEKGKEFLRVYALLIQAAEQRTLVTYMDVARIMGINEPEHHMSRMTGLMLGAVSEREREFGRPMLSAVAVAAGSRQPGKGFYGLAEQNRLISEDASEAEQTAFWDAERERVYEEWQG